jgi:hypothetical protein
MFIPRHPVIEGQFCSFGDTNIPGGAGNVVSYAGSVVYLDPTAVGEAAIVRNMEHGVTETPFGFSMQKVKTGYHSVHPVGMFMPGDSGSSDAIAQPKYDNTGAITGTQAVPIGVANLGIWDTVHYTCTQSTTVGTVDEADRMLPNQILYAAADSAKLTNSTTDSSGTDDNGERCSVVGVAKVVKGASAAKCTTNIGNTTLYPIRVKLLI